jgi:hypothetical protein
MDLPGKDNQVVDGSVVKGQDDTIHNGVARCPGNKSSHEGIGPELTAFIFQSLGGNHTAGCRQGGHSFSSDAGKAGKII